MGLSVWPQKNESHDSFQKFILLSEKISDMARGEDLNIVPFKDPKLTYFNQLKLSDQKIVLDKLELLTFICQQIQAKGERIRSAKSLTWAFMKHFQCVGPSDLLSCMNDNDFVDAYGKSHRMLFASLNFFEVSAYTLEDFFCRSWMELFERPNQDVHEMLLDLSEQMIEGKHDNIVSTQYIPTHECREKAIEGGLSIQVEPQCFSPLYNKGEIIGYLCINRGEVLGNIKAQRPI